MSNCDMCGKENKLVKVNVEGTILNVCGLCSKFGDVIEEIRIAKPIRFKKVDENVEDLVEGFGEIVKRARERRNLMQRDVAKELNVKESIIHKIETGSFVPDLVLAKKLENFFSVKLIKIYGKLDFKDRNLRVGDLL